MNVWFPNLVGPHVYHSHIVVELGVPGEVLVSPVKPHPRVNVQHRAPLVQVKVNYRHANVNLGQEGCEITMKRMVLLLHYLNWFSPIFDRMNFLIIILQKLLL